MQESFEILTVLKVRTQEPYRSWLKRNTLEFESEAQISRKERIKFDAAKYEVLNKFSMSVEITDADFVSGDEPELMHPRQANRARSAIDFLRLSPGSDIDAFEQ